MHHRIRTTRQARRIRAGITAGRRHVSADVTDTLAWRAYLGTINRQHPSWVRWA